MKKMRNFLIFFYFFLAIVVWITHSYRGDPDFDAHLLMPRGSESKKPSYCDGWLLGVETNNIRNWRVVPEICASYVANYMTKNDDGVSQYEVDVWVVVLEAMDYVQKLKSIDTKTDAWVFDIDETALSNLVYYSDPNAYYGSKPFNGATLRTWFEKGEATALMPVLALYDFLVSKGIKIVFLTGVDDTFKEIREKNLENAGYKTWAELILKSPKEKAQGLRTGEFKSLKRAELATKYKIIGNIGDQWSDITGSNVGDRTFKVPNPMYYI